MSQNIETKFKYNGAEYEFDVRDADDAEKFEAAINAMKEAEKEVPKTGKTSEIIRAQCKMLKDFFDGCLGEGAGVAICTDKSNISAHYAAYEHFLNYIKAQKDDILSAKNTFAKYSNRQQRRAAAKNNG
jgi:hypothetical protein